MKLKAAIGLVLGSLMSVAQAQMPAGYQLSSVSGILASSGNVPAIDGVAALAADNLYIYGINICVNDLQNVCQNKKAQQYNGSSWSAVGQGINNNYARDHATTRNGTLYLVGNFSNAYQSNHYSVDGTKDIARWDGSSWSAVGYGAGSYGSITAVAVVDNGGTSHGVYVGGSFEQMRNNATTSTDALGIAFWNGMYWSAVGGGLDGEVRALAYNQKTGSLYAAGSFRNAYSYGNVGQQTLNGIGKWTPNGWQPLGNGINGVNNLLVTDDGKTVFASGIGSGAYKNTSGYDYIAGTADIAYYTQANGWQGLGRSGLNFTVADAGAMVLLPDQKRLVVRLLDDDGYAYVAVWSLATKKWQVLYKADYSSDPFLGLDRAMSVAGDSIYVGDKVTSVTAGSQTYTINSLAKITVADIDGDGYEGAQDNCPSVPNADQADLDDDGIGDACDDDIDGDGVLNHQDRAPYDPNYTTTKPVANNFFGAGAGEKFGSKVYVVGKIDDDGVDDYAIAAPLATVIDANGKKLPKAGRVDVYSGFNDQLLISIEGRAKGEQLGHAIVAGSLDGVWKDDIVISSIAAEKKSGKVVVIYNGDVNSRVEIVGGKGEQLGFALAVGDVNGDSNKELMVSAIAANKKMGRVYVLDRAQISSGSLADALVIDGPSKGEFGYSLAVNEYSKRLYIGAPVASSQYVKKMGTVFVYKTPLSSNSLAGEEYVNGDQTGERFGHSLVAHPNDIGVAIGAPFHKRDKLAKAGRVKTLEHYSYSPYYTSLKDFYGVNKGEQFGWQLAVSGLGSDLLVGSPFAPNNDAKPLKKAGRVDIYPSWNSDSGKRTVYGLRANDQLGTSMAALDVTGDYIADILCGAPTAANGKLKNIGQVLFFDGASL